MFRTLIAAALMMTVTVLAGCDKSPSTANIKRQHIGRMSLFILAGQSNMSGRGILPENIRSDERVYVFGNDYQWKVAREPVDDTTNQVDAISRDGSAGFSPATSFAFELLERDPELVIGLIPCAKGNSSIQEWQKDHSVDSLYGSCLRRAVMASEVGEVVGLLFFQGETDAVNPRLELVRSKTLHPEDWDLMFSQMVAAFRDDLNSPDMPVIYAQLGETSSREDFPNWDLVKEMQRAVNLPNTSMIFTGDLPLQDGVHFTTDAYRQIGQRFAEAMFAKIGR